MAKYSKIETIVLGIRTLMVEAIPHANSDTVRITGDPQAMTRSPSDIVIYNITPSPIAEYDQFRFEGGGNEQLTLTTKVVVTAFMPHSIDEPDDITKFFSFDPSINSIRVGVLKAISGKNVYVNGVPQLNSPIRPIEHSWVKDKSAGDVQISFAIEYDENLLDYEDVVHGVN